MKNELWLVFIGSKVAHMVFHIGRLRKARFVVCVPDSHICTNLGTSLVLIICHRKTRTNFTTDYYIDCHY
jgi:hypothetical protein